MELLKLSKFQLQLQALISEVHDLKERERSASQQLQLFVQKQKNAEEETNKKLKELEAELVVSNEVAQKLERKINCLGSENALLENKQKELKETINNLLQSRDSFVKVYEDSTYEMKRAMEYTDRKIIFLSEKIKAHSTLVNSIEKEASSIKQIVNETQCILNEKEELVMKLMKKVHEIATFKKVFIERISDLEGKMRNNEEEHRRKDKIILGLESQLKSVKTNVECRPTVDELQKALLTKELIIQNLTSQKKVLHLEVGSLGFIIKKIQNAVMQMNEKDREAFSSVLEGQDECAKIDEHRTDGLRDGLNENREKCDNKDSGKEPADNSGRFYSSMIALSSLKYNVHPRMMNFKTDAYCERTILQSCVSESSCSPSKLRPQVASDSPHA